MSDNPENNIVLLVQPKRDEKELLNTDITDRKDYVQQRCKHRAIAIDEQHRLVKCKQCGCVVDSRIGSQP